jgi:hypothetical protein
LDVLSFWPSFSLLVFFLVILLECRAIAGRVTLPLGGFLMVFCYGAIGAPLLALLLQQVLTPSDATTESMRLMAWLIAPPIEELAKALPVIVLAFVAREARRLSIADLALIGFASGAGFGFVEGNLNALVNGTLPGFANLAALGLQGGNGAVFFPGHAVTTALVGLAAGIGLRFLPLKIVYAWAPSAFVILWASFDHGIYNWKLLNADGTGALPDAHFMTELLHIVTMKGQLATWVLPLGLIVAQFFEAYLCTKAVGQRRDLLLAREWRPWVVNEWLVALLRAPLGRAAFGQTLGYFRLRRAFYLASFEARRDPGDPVWTRHAHALEERLKRERSILFDPPPGTWLLPFPVLKTYAREWTWRMRWVLVFAILFVLLFLLRPRSLPDGVRQFLYGEPFTIAIVVAGLAFAVWQIVLFVRQPRPDRLAAEGAACAGYYTRALLLGCSFVCGLFPAATLLFGWTAFAPGAAFLSGYLPGWIAQGGNLQTLLGLGAVGSAVAPDPRPTGEAYRHEIAAANERLRRLALDIEDATGTPETASPGSGRPLQLEAFLDAMAKLDAERDAQARRRLVLDECERHAGEATITDPAPAAQAVKEEFDRLANELLDAAAKELDAIASIEQAYGRAWAEIMQDLDAHDVLRRRLIVPLRAAWQAHDDIGWALRVVEATDEGLLPMQLTLLPELHAVATGAQSARAEMVAAGIARIREAAAQYGDEDLFTFAGTQHGNEDEAALLAEFASSAPVEAPKPFGLRTPQPVEPAAQPDDSLTNAEELRPEANRVQKALDQLIGSTQSDERYLETIQHLERSTEALRQPVEPAGAKPQPAAHTADTLPEAFDRTEPQGELDDLIDAIKRDSGYLEFAKDTQPSPPEEDRVQPEPALVPEVQGQDTPEVKTSVALDEVDGERIDLDESAFDLEPEPAVASLPDTPSVGAQEAEDERTLGLEPAIPVGEPAADGAPLEPAQPAEPDEAPAAPAEDAAPTNEPVAAQTVDETRAYEAPIPAESVLDATPVDRIAEHPEPEELDTTPAPAGSENVEEQVAFEPFVLVAEEEPAADAEAAEPAPAPVTFEPSEQLALPLSAAELEAPRDEEKRAGAPEPQRTEPLSSPMETTERTGGEKPAPIEPQRTTTEPARLREPDEPQSRTEIRTSLFARLFQSFKRQSTEPSATQAHREEPKPIATEPMRPVLTPSVEDQPAALQAQTPSAEITSPTAEWLADFAAEAEAATARTDQTPLQPIEWPTLGRPAEADPTRDAKVEATAPAERQAADEPAQAHDQPAAVEPADTVAPAVEVESQVEADDAVVVSAPDDAVAVDADKPVELEAPAHDVETVVSAVAETEPTAPLDAADVIETVELEAPARDTADSSVAEQPLIVEPTIAADDGPAQAESTASATLEVDDVGKPQGTDEFASKADRLSYLLAKLEQAVQAKVAASATPGQASVPAVDSAPAEQTEIAAAQTEANEVPIAVEPKVEAPQQPVEPTAQVHQPDEATTPSPAEVSAVPEQPAPIADAQPSSDKPSPAIESPEPLEPSQAQPKPDRLSVLFNKLFDAARRETAERQTAPRHPDAEPAPALVVPQAEAAPAFPAESEILDLRGPHPLPESPDEIEHDSTVTPSPPLENKTDEPVRATATPTEAPIVIKPQPATPIDVAETTKPDPATTPSSAQPAAPNPRPRLAEPATHFGSRTKPPRPKSPARERDAQQPTAVAQDQVAPSNAPHRPAATAAEAAPAGAEAPATTPKRDWKLARGEPSKPIDAAPAESAKKPDIRIKTGSGALATTDAAPVSSPAATANTPGKYYGPRLAKAEDDGANSPAQLRALGLADALTQYYEKSGEPQPPMHTTDRATLQRIMSNGKLEAPRRRGAAWSTSGMSRRGEVAIRLKPGAEQYIEFVPSTEIFGQVPHYYPRGVGKGSFATHVPAGYLEYFDVTAHQWVPLLRGRE